MNSSETSEESKFILLNWDSICSSPISTDFISLVIKCFEVALAGPAWAEGSDKIFWWDAPGYELKHMTPNITARKRYPLPLLEAESLSRTNTLSRSISSGWVFSDLLSSHNEILPLFTRSLLFYFRLLGSPAMASRGSPFLKRIESSMLWCSLMEHDFS